MLWLVCITLIITITFQVFCLNTDHRAHGNRIIHETLTGSSLFPGITYDPQERE
jgi:hypothetical protein